MPSTTFKKTSMMRAIERQHPGKTIDQIVVDAINRTGSAEAAAGELGISAFTLRNNWMPEMGISIKPTAVVAEAT